MWRVSALDREGRPVSQYEWETGEATLGRDPDRNLVLTGANVSRRHARIVIRNGQPTIVDEGSANGVLVDGVRITAPTAVGPTNRIDVGEFCLIVRISDADSLGADDLDRGTGRTERSRSSRAASWQWPLLVGSTATLVIVVLAIYTLMRPSPTVRASGRAPLARLTENVARHLRSGKALLDERRFTDAVAEFDLAVELDPANLEARQLRSRAVHGTEDERLAALVVAGVSLGDRAGLESALATWSRLSETTIARDELRLRIQTRLTSFGLERCAQRQYPDCAWALCRDLELQPVGVAADPRVLQTLHAAESHLRRVRGYTSCGR